MRSARRRGILNSAVFSPLDLNPELWLDAADTTTITESSGSVSQWDDKSGNGYNVTQGTGALQPATGIRTLNSLNVLDFDGSTYLQRASTPAVTQPNTIFMVVQTDVASGTLNFIDGSGASNRQLIRLRFSNWAMWAGSFIQAGIGDTNPHIFRAVFDGSSSSLHVDAVSIVTGNAGANGLTGLTFGAAYTGGITLDGGIAEVIITNGILTADQIAATESYLAAKWGI